MPLPKYATTRCGGTDHKPLWKSKVTYWSISDKKYKEVTGAVSRTKTNAELSAADLTLEILGGKCHTEATISDVPSCEPEFPTKPKHPRARAKNTRNHTKLTQKRRVAPRTALFVDVENLPKIIDDVIGQIEGVDIYAFVGYHHCLSEKEFPESVTKVLSPSTRSDGSDSCMQVYIGCMLGQKSYDTYLIATRDHYGSALVDMITSDSLLWEKKNARVVTQVSHI